MIKFDEYEQDILDSYEKGEWVSTAPTKADLSKFKAAASATFIKDRRINIRISTPDLMDIQARALEEGIPYQTFIASVLHKYASGRLAEKASKMGTHAGKQHAE
jgi:predicted DNA binding CopG/RHH family protein